MKKLLLLSVAAAISVSAIGQTAPKRSTRVDAKKLSVMSPDNLTANQNVIPRAHAALKRSQASGNHTTAVNVVPLGQSANAFGNFYIGKSLLQCEPSLNTVTLFHRNSPAVTGDANTGFYRYDISTDGGSTWLTEQGPAYGPILNPTGIHNGRYPLGTIGNPTGNTDPNAAYEVYDGVWHDGVVWHGENWGMAKLDGSTHTENYDSLPTGNMVWIEDIFATKQNVIWRMGAVEADNAGTYSDTLSVEKGVWNGTDYVYTRQNLHFGTYVNSAGTPLRPYDMNVAFSDDGQIGYAVCLNNNDSTQLVYPTAVMYMQMYITTDGGATWTGADANTPFDVNVQYTVAGWFVDADPTLIDSTYTVAGWGAVRPDFDMAVDGNGNLHILVGVFPGNSFGESESTTGTWGLADLYTTGHGSPGSWYGQLIAKPTTYLGNFSDATNIQEGNRPFVSRSYDGTKMFFGWFDTRPEFATTLNDFPDLFVKGYDINTGLWTVDSNMTQGTSADAVCQYGLGSYYVKDDGACTYTIPAAYMTMEATMNDPCDFSYIDGATFSCSDFVIAGAPVLLSTTGISQVIKPDYHFSVSSNYPNPFSGTTYLDITLPSATDVTIEVSNMIGQVMSTTRHNLHAGQNLKVPVDCSTFAKGVYVYKVIAGSEVVTKTMTVR